MTWSLAPPSASCPRLTFREGIIGMPKLHRAAARPLRERVRHVPATVRDRVQALADDLACHPVYAGAVDGLALHLLSPQAEARTSWR